MTGLAPADHGSLRRAVVVAGAADGGDPINAAYTGVPGYVAWLALTWDPSDTTKDMTVQVNLHDQNTGSPIDFFDDSVEPAFGDPQFPNATAGCIVKHRKTAIGPNSGNVITHDGGPDGGHAYLQRIPPVYVQGDDDAYITRWRMRKARSDTDGDISFRTGMTPASSDSGLAPGPQLTDEFIQNAVIVVKIRSTGEIRSWALADQGPDTTEPYSWGTPNPTYTGSWARAIDDNEVDLVIVDRRYADLTNRMFTTATGGQAGPNLAGVHDIGLVIVGGDTFRLPLDVLPAGAQEPYTWTIPYDADLVSAMTGDVSVSLIDRSSPAVRWAQSAIVTERTRLSVVSITGVTEGSTDATLGEDYHVRYGPPAPHAGGRGLGKRRRPDGPLHRGPGHRGRGGVRPGGPRDRARRVRHRLDWGGAGEGGTGPVCPARADHPRRHADRPRQAYRRGAARHAPRGAAPPDGHPGRHRRRTVAGGRGPDPGHRRSAELLAAAGARIGVQLVRGVLAAAARGLTAGVTSPPVQRMGGSKTNNPVSTVRTAVNKAIATVSPMIHLVCRPDCLLKLSIASLSFLMSVGVT